MVAAHIHTHKVAGGRLHSVYNGMTTTGSVYLSEFVNQSLVNQLTDELGDSWHTQLQFPGQFSNSIVTLIDKMGNEILFYLNVFRAFVAFKKVIFYHVFTDFDYKGFDISKKTK